MRKIENKIKPINIKTRKMLNLVKIKKVMMI